MFSFLYLTSERYGIIRERSDVACSWDTCLDLSTAVIIVYYIVVVA